MIVNGYSENLNIKYSEVDTNSALKPFAILNFLQDIASAHAENNNFGYSYLYPKNMMWFVLKYHLEFNEYPVGIQDIKLVTEPRGFSKLFVFRDYDFYREDKIIGRASGMWAIIDTKTHTMIKPQIAIPDNPRIVPHVRKDDDLEFIKMKTAERIDLSDVFKVRYNDIDINGHANNGNYIVWALEPLNLEYRNNHYIKTLDIMYKKEANYNEDVFVEVEFRDELTTIHSLKNKNKEELCLVECHWINSETS